MVRDRIGLQITIDNVYPGGKKIVAYPLSEEKGNRNSFQRLAEVDADRVLLKPP